MLSTIANVGVEVWPKYNIPRLVHCRKGVSIRGIVVCSWVVIRCHFEIVNGFFFGAVQLIYAAILNAYRLKLFMNSS